MKSTLKTAEDIVHEFYNHQQDEHKWSWLSDQIDSALQQAIKDEREAKWLPIESAPRELVSDGYASKHGKRILVYPVRGIVAGARWFQSKVTPEAVGFVSDWQEVCEPTHWQPLPQPPAIRHSDTKEGS